MVTTLLPVPVAGAHAHPAELRPPRYFPREGGVALHRYLEPAFVPAFLADAKALLAGQLAPGPHFAWTDQDRFAGVDTTCLRHPITATFYMVSVEAVCRFPGEPALDPARIRSAGFVVRRLLDDGTQRRWMLVKGEAAGWLPLDGADLDPDLDRRGGREPPSPEPPYTGEQTYPLHALVAPDSSGRSRTVLHGFLPLSGGASRNPQAAGPGGSIPPEQQQGVRAALGSARAWPFGKRDAHAFNAADSSPISGGKPTPAFFAVLSDLVRRHGLGLHAGGDNEELERALSDWTLVATRLTGVTDFGLPKLEESQASFLDWLRGQLAPLAQDDASAGTSALHDQLGEQQPPAAPLAGLQPAGNVLDWRLQISSAQAAALRDALLARDLRLIDRTVGAAPRPRYSFADDERFVVVPFVRWAGARCTHVAWGQPSAPFRVASPYDPEAHRPQVVALPGLKDLRRGIAGAHFVAPKDLAEKILGMKAKGVDISKGSLQLPDLCWCFSFSLPAITICAFILLFIMISILNILFFWLPWIFLVLPSFCLLKKRTS